MSHIPIPPLLSSTPPPIDFDCVADNDTDGPPQLSEDTDDEFGDFAVVIEPPEILSLPDTPVHQESSTSTTSSGYIDSLPEFNEIILCDKLPAAPLKVKDNIDYSLYRQDNSTIQVDQESEEDTTVFPNPKSSTTTQESQGETMFVKDDISENNYQSDTICIKISQNSDEHVYFEDEDEVETKYDDSTSLPSLKFDTFSINSKISTTSPTISDDIVACTDDISAFQLDGHIAERTEQTSPILEEKALSSNVSKITHSKDEKETAHQETRKATDHDSSNYNENDVKLEKSEKNEEHLHPENDVIHLSESNKISESSDATFEADFSQFASFEATKSTEVSKNVETEKVNLESRIIVDPSDDDFDDFQDFTQAETLTLNGDNNDDEFGDFNNEVQDCAFFSVTASTTASNSNAPNLFDKLQPILAMMFPIDENCSSFVEQTSKEDNQKLKNINATNLNQIDSAKALDYQWSSSEVRHALIKSLGIDSRNILYGEKWNIMPRFAANLSFNPLEPIKPDNNFKADGNLKKIQASSSDLADQKKSDVPAVEFDWDSSGLVNPLDGSKEVIHEKSTEKIYASQSREFDEPSDGQSFSNAITNDNCNGKQTYQAFDCSTAATAIQSITESAAAMTTTATPATTTAATTTTSSISNTISSATTTVSTLNDNFAITLDKQINENNKPPQRIEFGADETNNKSPKLTTEKLDVSEAGDMNEISDRSVLSTSIYTGPLKETHIFTPSKSECLASLPLTTPKTSECNKLEPIDFDYNIAAAGMIIDEKVVKKEYRDVEYNPGFGLEFKNTINSEPETTNCDDFQNSSNLQRVPTEILQQSTSYPIVEQAPALTDALEVDDEFSDFQSVPAFELGLINSSILSQEYKTTSNIQKSKLSRTDTPVSTTDEMILSPAILLPQSIQIDKKPKIEWPSPGINPEELARIEELFPQPKTRLSSQNDTTSGNKVLSPKAGGHGSHNALTISEKVANQSNDDDDWSEFMSVPALNNFGSVSQSNRPVPSYSHLTAHLKRFAPDQYHSKRQQRSIDSSFSNDEEWSDFVSSAPVATKDVRPTDKIHSSQQFNSAAWHNANFYNNPLSYYHQQNFSKNVVTNFAKKLPTMNDDQRHEDQQQSRFDLPNSNNNNNNSIKKYNFNNINQFLNNNHYLQQQQQQQQNDYQRQHHQQIQMMNDFSSVSSSYQIDGHPTQNYISGVSGNNVAGPGKTTNAFGSAKVAPCISLIPDLAFVAPPSSTSFMTSLPGTDFANLKK